MVTEWLATRFRRLSRSVDPKYRTLVALGEFLTRHSLYLRKETLTHPDGDAYLVRILHTSSPYGYGSTLKQAKLHLCEQLRRKVITLCIPEESSQIIKCPDEWEP